MKKNRITTPLIEKVRSAAREVRRHYGPGFLESVYKNALIHELQLRDIKVQSEVAISITYKGVEVGNFRADLVVEDELIVELKACSYVVKEHSAQLVNYLVATGIEYGMIINFGAETLFSLVRTREYRHDDDPLIESLE